MKNKPLKKEEGITNPPRGIASPALPSYPRSIYDLNWAHKETKKNKVCKFFGVPVYWEE